jgi:hypothetical protein
MAAFGGADHKFTVVAIKICAEGSAERAPHSRDILKVSSKATTPTAMMATTNPAFASRATRSAGLTVAARAENRRVMPVDVTLISSAGRASQPSPVTLISKRSGRFWQHVLRSWVKQCVIVPRIPTPDSGPKCVDAPRLGFLFVM